MSSDKAAIEEDYANAGFGGALGFGEKPALLVVDMCMAYLDPAAPLYAGVEAEAEQIERLLTAFRAASRPVFHTRVEYVSGGADGGLFYKKVAALRCFDRGNPLADPPSELRPEEGEVVITKQYASAFFGTTLASTLSSLGCDTVVITGVSTSGCVRATALDTIQNGFIPLVVKDACGDRDETVHAANLFDLQAKYADLITTNLVIERVQRGWR